MRVFGLLLPQQLQLALPFSSSQQQVSIPQLVWQLSPLLQLHVACAPTPPIAVARSKLIALQALPVCAAQRAYAREPPVARARAVRDAHAQLSRQLPSWL